jgi:uncharacterized protein with PQ loop repeat
MPLINDGPLKTILEIITPAGFIALQLAGARTALRCLRAKQTFDLSIAPFLALAANCTAWLSYGILIEDVAIKVSNSSAVFVGLSSAIIFTVYSSKKRRTLLPYWTIALVISR